LQFTVNKKNILNLGDGFIFVIVIFFALFLRTYKLDIRPMHTDEAVHAVKFGELLENDSYKYDPVEYHGPTLNYFTLISTSLLGEKTLKEINEVSIRIIPAIFSFLLIVSLLLLVNKNNFKLIILITFILTISPVIQFYSRYYIQEILLVAFSYSGLLTFYKYFRTKKVFWLIISGVLVGLTFATKETSIITFFAAIVTIFILGFLYKEFRKSILISKGHLSLVLIIAVFVSVLFYSSFFNHLKGISDSILTFTNYFSKAGSNPIHIQPWYYYIDLMSFANNGLLFYSSIPISFFILTGYYFIFLSQQKKINIFFFKFIAIFSLVQVVVYSTISYKTPWLVLNFWVGFLFIAGFGIYHTYRISTNKIFKRVFAIIIILVFSHNIYQTYITSFKFSYQIENPFTYSQPSPQITRIAQKVLEVANGNNEELNIFVNVIATKNDYWPLPWYLRKLNNVAWNNYVPDDIYKFPIILATPDFEEKLIDKLYSFPPAGEKNLYIPLLDKYLELRPNMEIRGYVQKEYFDLYLRTKDEF